MASISFFGDDVEDWPLTPDIACIRGFGYYAGFDLPMPGEEEDFDFSSLKYFSSLEEALDEIDRIVKSRMVETLKKNMSQVGMTTEELIGLLKS